MLKLNLGSGDATLDGFVNLTPPAWRFQDGLGDYADGTVDGITISHALYLVPLYEWPKVFAEFARVLKPGGVVRITEDATDDPNSERYGGFRDAVTLTSRSLVRMQLGIAGLTTAALSDPDQEFDNSSFVDRSLIQQLHGRPPKVFAAEGVKP